jgi:DNA recombination protein RmuC
MVIRLPGGAGIPVDSKCPFSAFQQAKEETEALRVRELMEEHEAAVRAHVNTLSRKDYSEAVKGDVDFTVMFMPGDHLLEAALTINPKLQEDALNKRILITNPVTLVALLRTVRIYWRQEETDRNSRKISEAARLLYERATVWSTHVTKIGKGLGSAVKAYNESVGSYEGRMRPMLEKLDELKVPGSKTTELEKSQSTPAEIEENIRNLPGF